MTRPADLPVPIPAVILVIVAVPTNVQEVPRITAVPLPVRPNADQPVVTAVPHAQAEVPLIPVPLSGITNAEAPAALVQRPVPQELLPLTPEAAAVRPQTNAGRRPVIILIKVVVHILLM